MGRRIAIVGTGIAGLAAAHALHRDLAPRAHGFRLPITLAYLDLDELPELLDGRLTTARPGLVRFRRADYLGDPAIPLADAVRDLVRRRTGSAPDGPIRLLTHLRTMGRAFNPVSFYYYCHGADGALRTIVAEVTNTPWGERHAYVLDGATSGSFAKALHVSPFFGMGQRYRWQATPPGDELSVRIANHEGRRRVFAATLRLRRRPLTRRGLARHAGSSLRVVPLIYIHAIALKVKGARLHPHPAQAP